GVATVAPLNGTTDDQISAMSFNAAGTLYGALLSLGGPASLITINKFNGAITTLGPTVDRLDAIVFDNTQPTGAALVAAVLPSSRSVQIPTQASAFATIINAGPFSAIGVCISQASPVPATFAYQTTDPATNALTGSA